MPNVKCSGAHSALSTGDILDPLIIKGKFSAERQNAPFFARWSQP